MIKLWIPYLVFKGLQNQTCLPTNLTSQNNTQPFPHLENEDIKSTYSSKVV